MPTHTPPAAWYWCLRHNRPEADAERCAAADTLGPYGSSGEAQRWQEKVEARNKHWDEQDRQWSGDEEDA